ncbi:hypothetical protein Q3G72_029553 [Acer saccharum]|nr:hypothetical protein Q3G72_029553 [Acer saccharum]
MADSYHGTDNFTAPSEESKGLEFDTTQSMEEEEDNDVTQSMEEEEDNDVTQMGKEIVEYKSIPSKSGRRVRRRLSSEVWEVFVKLPRSSDGRERNKCKLCGKVYLCESILAATGNMKRHLKMCPKMKIHDVDQLFESGSEGGSSSDSDRKDPQVFQELVTAAIIMHDLPLRFFEWSHVRKMIEFVSDDVNLVSKETTEMDVLKVHRREKEVVKTMIEEAYVSMTNSTGTSTSKASFASGVTSTFTHGTSFDLMDTVMKEFDSSLVSDDCIQKTQLELYLDEPRLDRSMDLDILSFWKELTHSTENSAPNLVLSACRVC